MDNVYINEYMNEETLKELFSGTQEEIDGQLFYIKLQTNMDLSDLPTMYEIKKKYPSFYLYESDYKLDKPNMFYNAERYGENGYYLNIMDNIMIDKVKFPYSFNYGICCHLFYKLNSSGSYNMQMDRYFSNLNEAKQYAIDYDIVKIG